METKAKNNGQAKVANTVQADKTPKFVAGNPVNTVGKAQEQKEESKPQGGQRYQNQRQVNLKLKQDLRTKNLL